MKISSTVIFKWTFRFCTVMYYCKCTIYKMHHWKRLLILSYRVIAYKFIKWWNPVSCIISVLVEISPWALKSVCSLCKTDVKATHQVFRLWSGFSGRSRPSCCPAVACWWSWLKVRCSYHRYHPAGNKHNLNLCTSIIQTLHQFTVKV